MPELTKADYIRVGQYVFLKGKWRIHGGRVLRRPSLQGNKSRRIQLQQSIHYKEGRAGRLRPQRRLEALS